MVRIIPKGGIGIEKLADYLALKGVAAVGGSWMAAPDLLKAGKLAEATRLASEAVAVVNAMG